MCVVVRAHTIILLWFSYSTWHGILSFINFSAVKSVGNCQPQYSFCNLLNNRIRKFVCCMLCYCSCIRYVDVPSYKVVVEWCLPSHINITTSPSCMMIFQHTKCKNISRAYNLQVFLFCYLIWYKNYIMAINFQQNSKKKNL